MADAKTREKEDEVKFVIGDRNDFDWSKKIISEYKLDEKSIILFSPVFKRLENNTITI